MYNVHKLKCLGQPLLNVPCLNHMFTMYTLHFCRQISILHRLDIVNDDLTTCHAYLL